MVNISGSEIGDGEPTYVVAEAGINHNGDIGTAKELIDEAERFGSDAVKFQTYNTEKRVDETSDVFDVLKKCELREEETRELFDYADTKNIEVFSTPFDLESVNLLEDIGVNVYKIPSFYITHKKLLRRVAETGKPVIFSTGTADRSKVRDAIEIFEKEGSPYIPLHCVSSYPTQPQDANLEVINTLREICGDPVGFSDHTEGIEVPGLSVAVGASVIEKHFTLDSEMEGPDHELSIEPEEFRSMVERIRRVESILGSGELEFLESEKDIKPFVKTTE